MGWQETCQPARKAGCTKTDSPSKVPDHIRPGARQEGASSGARTCDGAALRPEKGLQLAQLVGVHLGNRLVLHTRAAEFRGTAGSQREQGSNWQGQGVHLLPHQWHGALAATPQRRRLPAQRAHPSTNKGSQHGGAPPP